VIDVRLLSGTRSWRPSNADSTARKHRGLLSRQVLQQSRPRSLGGSPGRIRCEGIDNMARVEATIQELRADRNADRNPFFRIDAAVGFLEGVGHGRQA
jgi:hypothetical protein